jgi:uncharacterized protein HemY
MILLSLAVSLGFYALIDYCLNKGYLDEHTTTFGYIVTSIILGFTLVWVVYRLIEWLYKIKKIKK